MKTWLHCCPVQTPPSVVAIAICVEKYVYGVATAGYDWRQEIGPRGCRGGRVAATPVHQQCPVPICDLDIGVLWPAHPIWVNGKVSELNFQQFSVLCLN